MAEGGGAVLCYFGVVGSKDPFVSTKRLSYNASRPRRVERTEGGDRWSDEGRKYNSVPSVVDPGDEGQPRGNSSIFKPSLH